MWGRLFSPVGVWFHLSTLPASCYKDERMKEGWRERKADSCPSELWVEGSRRPCWDVFTFLCQAQKSPDVAPLVHQTWTYLMTRCLHPLLDSFLISFPSSSLCLSLCCWRFLLSQAERHLSSICLSQIYHLLCQLDAELKVFSALGVSQAFIF